MPQPPTIPVLAHELTRILPALAQKTFSAAAADANQVFRWEFDLAARITDHNQFLNANPAPANSSTIAGGGAGPQTTPQVALGPIADVGMFFAGAGGGQLLVEFAVDANPCLYRAISPAIIVPAATFSNLSGLRITGRFVRFSATNITAASLTEVGFYIRNL
jgi:hypothetical protein